MNINFDEIWNNQIKPLEGSIIVTLDYQLENKIKSVTDNYLERDTKNKTQPQKVPKEIFKAVYMEVMEKGEISRVSINTKYPKRYSSIICAVLSKLNEDVTYDLNPIRLLRK